MIVRMKVQSTLILNLAWIYVGLRYLHAFIHIVYNQVMHRFLVYITSCLVLLAMWVLFLFEINAQF